MSNPLREIIIGTGKPPSRVLENELRGIVWDATFYSLIDERGIPAKTHWTTIEKVAQALGYKIVFEPVNNVTP